MYQDLILLTLKVSLEASFYYYSVENNMANQQDRIGQQVGDYCLLRWLGGGGFGEVYLAEHVRDHAQVAIKLLHVRFNRSEELKTFINEARMIRLQHAHIVPLLDFDISQEQIPFLVMEYAAQGTLRDYHPKGSQVPLPLIVDYAQQVGSALQYAHEQRLIHRDVKPQNMLLRADGTVLLSDFGLVAIEHSSDSLSPPREAVGTIAYMAPEQIQGRARAESDQYSLGVVVYEWITGRRPFEGAAVEIAMQHAIKPPPSLVAQVPTLARAVEEVVLKALAKDPKGRFGTVQDFTAALKEVVRGASPIRDGHKTSPMDNDEPVSSPSMGNLAVPSLWKSFSPELRASVAAPQVDWGDAPAVPNFYGREEEQAKLIQWVLQEQCRLVGVLGMGGIGKSALSVSVMRQIAEHFEVVIFRALRDAPSCSALLDDCLQVLCPQALRSLPSTFEQRLNLLLEHLRKVRALVVLDNLESLLEEGDIRGRLRPDFEEYGQLLHRVAQTGHQSCLIFTSREKPAELRMLAGKYASVQTLRLMGLDVTACQQLLVEKGLIGTKPEQERLIEAYAGNPLALNIAADTIVDLFGGEIDPFLTEGQGLVLFSGITDLLDEQFGRLSALEQTVLYWLAIVREPVTPAELLTLLVAPRPRPQGLLETIDSLWRRSLIERGKHRGSFTLQSVVLEYVTAVLIAEGSREIQQGQLDRLIKHGLSLAKASEYVRQTQERLLVSPLLAELQSTYPSQSEMEAQLLSLLDELREQDDDAQGYGPVNLITLLRLLRGNLNGLDLSHLCIRSAYLQGIEMQETSLSGSLIHDGVWTSAVNATSYVTISPNGKWWATGGGQGEVCVWEASTQTLRLSFSAHASTAFFLASSPDGRTLASGSIDGTVKLWNVENGALLWTGKQKCPYRLAFAPDGRLLASGGEDATVRLWGTESGRCVQTLTHASSVYAVAFSPDGRFLASGSFDGALRLWQKEQKDSAIWIEICSVQTGPLGCLVFAPDGRTLGSAHVGQTVRLWDAESLHLRYTFPDLQAKYLAWSPDGRTLACCMDKKIWLWDVEQDRYRAVLHGHRADITSLAFTPDSSRLLSNDVDGVLRLWDMQRGECVRVVDAYSISLIALDWSPDGTHLVSGGNDRLVTIWDVNGATASRVLRGHHWYVYGTRWSPDGQLVASCSWDQTIRLWNVTTGACVQRFEDPHATYLCLTWNPDGSLLACGTSWGGIQVWDVRAGQMRWVGQPSQTMFFDVAWNPDGTKLAGSGSDGCVYLWESRDGTQVQRLTGHHDWVYNVRWSPDGTRLASCGRGEDKGELFVWDGETGECVQAFVGCPGLVYAVTWSSSHEASPPREQLISGGSDGMLSFWDVESGECVRTLASHQKSIHALRVSPNGKFLASCGHDTAVMVWNLVSFERVRTLRLDRPYERLNMSGIIGLNEAEIASLRALGAFEGNIL